MKFSRDQNQVNAGSMADIAFLLLIFFLVTTVIPNDVGIPQKLPRECLAPPCEIDIHENNVFRIMINKNHQILVENEIMAIKDLRNAVKLFVDNNADGSCYYCSGQQLEAASDSPQKAILSLTTDRETEYSMFISVQNELIAAYAELRARYALKKYGKILSTLTKEKFNEVRNAYPQMISEAATK